MRSLFILAAALSVFLFTAPASAEVVLNDHFINTAHVDLAKTTARVDTAGHCVLLSWQSLSGSLNILRDGMGYAVASQSGVILYEFDEAAGEMVVNTAYSCPWATDATGVSIRQDNLNMWAISPDSMAYYRFNGAGMSNDPALKINGLNNVLSVAAFRTRDSALILQRDGGKAKITRYDAGASLNPVLVFDPDIENPVSVSMVNDSPDFRLFTRTAAYYFMYDEAGNAYLEDPAKRITGLPDVVSASSDDVGNSVLTTTDLVYYINNDAGGAARVEVYSPGPVNNPVAVSLRPGTSDQVFLDESGNVQWWAHDDGAGRMVRVPGLEVSELNLNRGYASPGIYYSTAISTATSYDAVRLTAAEDLPDGTSISYSVSSDGGASFVPATNGVWTAVPRGGSFVLKAALDTANPLQTPKILHVSLEAGEDMVLDVNVSPYPAERGRNVTISARAVRLTTGEPVMLDACSVRYPLETKANGDQALPEGHLPTDAQMIYNEGTGYWDHTFAVPEKTTDGRWPDDGVYQVRVAGRLGAVQKEAVENLEVSGHILRRLIVRTLSW